MSTSRVGRNQEVDRSEHEVPPRGPSARVAFVPSPEEIRQACEQIRAEWSPEEWAKRVGERHEAARIPLVKSRHLPVEGDNPADEDF
jgi:hypothetical protein